MRIFGTILTGAAIALVAGMGAANAQATNFAPHSGNARAYYGNGSDVPGYWDHRAMDRRAYARSPRVVRSYGPRYAPHPYGRTEGIPPALYHAGDPQYWR